MVEVFKTDVVELYQANMIIEMVQKDFPHYKVNFDLSDCDRILRVECATEHIQCAALINILKAFGHCAEVLPDSLPTNAGSTILVHN